MRLLAASILCLGSILSNAQADAGSADFTFQGNINEGGTVYATAVQTDGKIIIGGSFTSVNGVSKSNLARLNADGSLDTGFTASASGTVGSQTPNSIPFVVCLALQTDGKILLGGTFDTINGIARAGFARLNTNGTLDSLNPSLGAINGATFVESIIPLSNGKIYLGGAFASVNSTSRNGIALLNADGTLDTSFNPGTAFTGGGNLFSEGRATSPLWPYRVMAKSSLLANSAPSTRCPSVMWCDLIPRERWTRVSLQVLFRIWVSPTILRSTP